MQELLNGQELKEPGEMLDSIQKNLHQTNLGLIEKKERHYVLGFQSQRISESVQQR